MIGRQTIFISCGQFTEAERRLGKQIAQMVRDRTDLQPFFAEEVQDLNGLDANILDALHDCVGFITVLHPRGEITRPDKFVQIRASVWIEQEIAVATYIQRVEKRPLPIIAFKHVSVGREGIRDLLHLNPIEFKDENEVLAALPERLDQWKSLPPSAIQLVLKSVSAPTPRQDDHAIRRLEVTLINDTNRRIAEYICEVQLPTGILKHWGSIHMAEIPSKDPTLRRFRFDQTERNAIGPRDKTQLIFFDYCTKCAFDDCGGISALVAEAVVSVRIWIDGHEYTARKTIQELAEDAERSRSY